jgi:ferredoxin-type protein NapF
MSGMLKTRREFFFGRSGASPAGPFPPGVTLEALKGCNGCGVCAETCPAGIIKIADGVPVVDFSRGECTFCGQCAERCPERVFPPEPVARFDHAMRLQDSCLALNFVDCQSCRDACPEMAIRFRPTRGGPFRPALDEDACTGCGACLSVCPVGALAIVARCEEVAHV